MKTRKKWLDDDSFWWSLKPLLAKRFTGTLCCRLPTLFVAEKPEPIRFPPLELGPLSPAYERIGYDAVSVGAPRPEEIGLGDRFLHSSLSPFCNGRCQDIPVNRFCLLDTEEDGLRRAQEFSAGGGEPEPYVAVEVWRKRREGRRP